MIVLTFTSEEISQIAEESPIFAAKIAKIAKPQEPAKPSRPIDDEANAFLDRIYDQYGQATCVNKLREWAKSKGISKYSSLAGAKRLVEARRHQG